VLAKPSSWGAAAGSDETCVQVTTGEGRELQLARLRRKTSTGVEVAAEVLRVINLARPVTRDIA
jgi:hypothetical protein